jgi:hypothetical protein
MRFFSRRKWWATLLGVYLIWTGLVALVQITFAPAGTISNLLAIAAGVLVLLDR